MSRQEKFPGLIGRVAANAGNIKLGRRRALEAAGLAVGSVALAGCGGGEKPEPSPTTNPESRTSPAERLKRVERATAIVEDKVRRAFEAVTNSYSGIKHTDVQIKKGEFQRLRQMAFSKTTTQQIVNWAKEGSIFFDFNHPGVISEFEFFWYFVRQPKDAQTKLLEAYAEAVVEGLAKAAYDKNKPLAVALEIGHISNPPMDKVNKVNEDRKRRGVSPIYPTQDVGAREVVDGQTLVEKDYNLPLARLIALKIMENYPYWFPILNAQEEGFMVDRFIEHVPDSDSRYIHHGDSILSMKYKWEKLASELDRIGMKMVRVAVHFNGDAEHKIKGGYVMAPVYGRYAQESQNMAKAISDTLREKIRRIDPAYTNRVETDLNSDPNGEYWSLNGWDKDDPKDVQEGRPERVTGVSNKLLATIRKAQKERK